MKYEAGAGERAARGMEEHSVAFYLCHASIGARHNIEIRIAFSPSAPYITRCRGRAHSIYSCSPAAVCCGPWLEKRKLLEKQHYYDLKCEEDLCGDRWSHKCVPTTQPNAKPLNIRPACTCRCTQPCAKTDARRMLIPFFPSHFAWRLFLLLSFFFSIAEWSTRPDHSTDGRTNNNNKNPNLNQFQLRKRNQKTAYTLWLCDAPRSTGFFPRFFCLNWKTNRRDSGYGRAHNIATTLNENQDTKIKNNFLLKIAFAGSPSVNRCAEQSENLHTLTHLSCIDDHIVLLIDAKSPSIRNWK